VLLKFEWCAIFIPSAKVSVTVILLIINITKIRESGGKNYGEWGKNYGEWGKNYGEWGKKLGRGGKKN
jgi:hypothetical protein